MLDQERGSTLYVGAPSSDVRGRLYDKGRESRDAAYVDCWRWEVQARRSYALSALRALAEAADPSETVASTVGRWFTDRGVRAGFNTVADSAGLKAARAVPDDARWLEWVRRCVQPRARELTVRYGWRYVAEACVGRIGTFEEWEALVSGIELELVGDV